MNLKNKLLSRLVIQGAAGISLIFIGVNSYAQQGNEVLDEMVRCSNLVSEQVRLACYDAVTEQIAPAREQAGLNESENVNEEPDVVSVTLSDPVVAEDSASNPVTEQVDQQAVEQFGTQASIRARDDGEQELVDTVVSLKRVGSTKWSINLDSGQIWNQTIGKRFQLREGDLVRIYPSGWGDSFRLSVEGRPGFIQVARVK